MVDAHLVHTARKYLENGHTLQEVHMFLQSKGHSRYDIDVAVREFFRDEATDYDDKLIKHIERKFTNAKDGRPEYLQTIFAELVKEGHKPFEIEKAMLRAHFTPQMRVRKVLKRWEMYSIVQIVILVITVLLSIFYSWLFVPMVLVILACMQLASMHVPNTDPVYRKELGMIPGIGLWTREGIFGYNATTGNFWRVMVLDPSIVVSGAFMMLAIIGAITLGKGVAFVVVCVFLALLSDVSFTVKPPDTSGPPYHPIFAD
jgi:hypothetical protein